MDESFTLAQAVCGGNAGSMAFVLMPQPHSSCSHTAILAHRRILEDKAVATLDGISCVVASQGVSVCALSLYLFKFVLLNSSFLLGP